MKIFKFGGASIKNAEAVKNVAMIINRYEDDTVIVISAMGKSTNFFERIISHSFQDENNEAMVLWNEIMQDHISVAKDLGVGEIIEEDFQLFNDDIINRIRNRNTDNYDQWYDQLICFGELMSTRIVAAYLNNIGCKTTWVDARKIIKTDNQYRIATVSWKETQKLVQESYRDCSEKESRMLTQGFIGSNDQQSTSLGREGSDYTAAIISYCLDAESVTVWKDVPGVLSGDPRKVRHAELLPKLSYREAIELTYYGAQVIHPKTIQPLQNKKIPLHVRSFIDMEGAGTTIDQSGSEFYMPMIVITEDQYLMKLSSKDYSFIAEQHLSELFRKLNYYRVRVNLMRNSAISFTICVSAEPDRYQKLKNELEESFKVEDTTDLTLITLRHYNQSIVNRYKRGKEILFEEIQGDTYQMVTKI